MISIDFVLSHCAKYIICFISVNSHNNLLELVTPVSQIRNQEMQKVDQGHRARIQAQV